MVVVDGHGGYVPLYRIDRADVAEQHGGRARGESAVPGRDENHVTMACEAVTTALSRSEIDSEDIDGVFAASTTDPLAEHGIAAHVAYQLGVTGDIRTGDFQATARACTDALTTVESFVSATGGNAIVVAVDVLPASPDDDGSPRAGAGAAALVLRSTSDEPIVTFKDIGQETTGFVERHREHGAPAIEGDGRFERERSVIPATRTAIKRALGAGSVGRSVLGVPDPRLIESVLKEFDTTYVTTFDEVGNAGTALPLLDFVHLLETSDPDERVLLGAYGAGGADALVLNTETGVSRTSGATVSDLVETKEYVSYAKHLEYRKPVEYQGITKS